MARAPRLPDFSGWSPADRKRLLAVLKDAELRKAGRSWADLARPAQLPPPGDWFTWLILAGRGFGKTRSGAEWALEQARHSARGALIAPTAADARDIMVEGESGILACAPATMAPLFEPSKRRITYANGAIQTLYSADEPDRLRGPQHHYAWVEEWAAMRKAGYLMDMARMGLRLGQHPRMCITTTPRPLPELRKLLKKPDTTVTRGTTYENLGNLAPTFREHVLDAYEGTRLGRQELGGEVLDDIEGALFMGAWIRHVADRPRAHRVVVGVDPATSTGPDSDETGIVVAQLDREPGPDGKPRVTVLADLTGRYTPDEWAHIVCDAARKYRAAEIVYETNQGGNMVRRVIMLGDPPCPLRGVTAKKSKQVRAEPVAGLYQQGRVAHWDGDKDGGGELGKLETCITEWVPDVTPASPDRLDALVYAVVALVPIVAVRPVQVVRT